MFDGQHEEPINNGCPIATIIIENHEVGFLEQVLRVYVWIEDLLVGLGSTSGASISGSGPGPGYDM